MICNFKKVLFILVFIFSSLGTAEDILEIFGFETSLERFMAYQKKPECNERSPLICPALIADLVKDDNQDRALIIESRASDCRSARSSIIKTGPPVYQKAVSIEKLYATRFSYLGDYSHSTIRSCLKNNNEHEVDLMSKFYYYNARLNQGAGKVAQERVLISKILKKPGPICPAGDVLAAANKICEQSKKCSDNLNIEQLAKAAENDEALYEEILNKLNSFPQNCEQDEKCKIERAGLSAALVGLIKLNPWFLAEDFKNSKKKSSMVLRLQNYLTITDKNLMELQNKIQDTSQCIHGTKSKKCELDDVREVLNQTPDLPEIYIKDKAENQLTYLMSEQSCLEKGSLDRNQTGKIMTDTYWNMGLTIATLGLGAIANSARLAAAGTYSRTGRVLAESTNLSFDVYGAAMSVKDVAKACGTDQMSFQFKNLEDKEVCENKGSALSSSSREQSSCLVSMGFGAFSALAVIPGGARIVKLMQKSAETNPSVKSVVTRKQEAVIPHIDNRNHLINTRTVTTTEGSIGKNVELKTVPNLPSSIRVSEIKKIDGSKGLVYSYGEKLQDGTWVKNSKELLLDPISGGINANFSTGRDLFEKIANEKSGKAHLVFIDVGGLGAVNKTFKEGGEAGEKTGDRYLKAIAEKIIKSGDGKITLARLGGDEFGLIIDESDPQKVKSLLEKIQADIRLNLNDEPKKIFSEEKILRAGKYKREEKKILNENPEGLTKAQKSVLREEIDELAHLQQPDISIGSTQIGRTDKLALMLEKAEEQAKKMKIQTALQFGRSAEKYGSSAVPRVRPDPMYRAPVELPLTSTSWAESALSQESAPALDLLREMSVQRKEEIKRFGSTSLARYEDELGRGSYRIEKYVSDSVGEQKRIFSTEVPTRGNTGMLDGVHPESQKLIMDHVQTSADTVLVMPKLSSLKYLNYFESGSRAGDEMLEAVSEVLKNNMRSEDLAFKLNGADFLWSLNNTSASELLKIEEKLNLQLLQNPKAKQILENERLAISAKINDANKADDPALASKLKEKLEAVKNFKLNLNFRSISRQEALSAGNFPKILKKFDEKFK